MCEWDADFLYIRASVRRVYMKINIVYMKFLWQFSQQLPSQQLPIAYALNFNTLFLLAHHMVRFISHESDVNFLL